jgi:integrase
MATTKLKIRNDLVKKNKGEETTIYVQYCYEGKIKLFNTGQKIRPEDWDNKSGRVKAKGHGKLIALIDQEHGRVKDIVSQALFSGIAPTLEYVEERLKAVTPTAPEVKKDFFQLYDSFIEETAHQRVKRVQDHYKSSLQHLRNFSAEKKYKIELEGLGLEFYDKFLAYLINDKKLSSGTVNNQVKRLKVFFAFLQDRGLKINFDISKFKNLQLADTDIVFLTQKELETLFKFDFSENKKLERVRDLLVFACASGLRQSDFSTISPENVKDGYLLIRTRKTRDSIRIPLNPYSAAILKKYEGKLPKISQQKFNKYVKTVGEACKINEPTEVTRYTGSKAERVTEPKHNLLSSHTGRRTFVTQSLERGMNAQEIMSITGHKDVKTLMRYVKVTDTAKVNAMARAWGSPLSVSA